MKPVIDYTLYLVTDRDLMSTETLEQAVEAACAGGVTLVQLREKHASRSEFVDLARRVKRVCDKHDIPLIINDEPRDRRRDRGGRRARGTGGPRGVTRARNRGS